MTSSEVKCCRFQVNRCVWCSAFAAPPPRISKTESIPYVDIGLELDAEDNPIRFFMRDQAEPPSWSSRADLVEEFCTGTRTVPETPDDDNDKSQLKPIALVDDRSIDGDILKGSAGPVALSAKQLLSHLTTKQAVENRPLSRLDDRDAQSALGSSKKEHFHGEEPPAGRRLYFIANPDYKTVLALVKTASTRQAWALRDSIYNHLAFKCFIMAAVAWNGLPAFRLAFDLPFYVLSRSQNVPVDLPRRRDGTKLRCCEKISFLSAHLSKAPGTSSHPENLYLCPAHVACVVSGTHNSRWEANMFLDTWYGGDEVIEENEYCSGDSGEFHFDPLRPGKPADIPILDPRLYFLDALDVRAQRVKGEWREVLHLLSCNIEPRISSCAHRQKLSGSGCLEYPTTAMTAHKMQTEDEYNWAVDTIELLARLRKTLRSTHNQWAAFKSQKETYFGNMGKAADRSFQSIESTFSALKAYNEELGDIKDLCEGFIKDSLEYLQYLSADLALSQLQDLNTGGEKQFEVAEKAYLDIKSTKTTGTILMILGLVQVVASVFSIPGDGGFFPANTGHIILSFVGFCVTVFGAQVVLGHHTLCRKFISRIFGTTRLFLTPKARRLWVGLVQRVSKLTQWRHHGEVQRREAE